ncbi:hypothetical protein BwSF12_55110 [Bradyrhizobium ottawaense]|nr:hypothetical protein BwSF12_55110 [Bradyrhizobium ottawaense]GMO95751.1 hypothetical protein BwSF19_76180 [Bradyrhizobium ottawaense]
MPGITHADAKRFCFIATGNDAAIVVREDDYGLAAQGWLEDTFAGSIEVIAIYQGDGRCHA